MKRGKSQEEGDEKKETGYAYYSEPRYMHVSGETKIMHISVLFIFRGVSFVTLVLAKVVKNGRLLHRSDLLDSQRALAATKSFSATITELFTRLTS